MNPRDLRICKKDLYITNVLRNKINTLGKVVSDYATDPKRNSKKCENFEASLKVLKKSVAALRRRATKEDGLNEDELKAADRLETLIREVTEIVIEEHGIFL